MLCWLRDLSSKGRNVSARRYNNGSIEVKVKTPAQTLWAPRASGLTGKETTVMTAVIDPDHQGEIGLLPHHGGKEECVWATGHHLGLVILPCPVIKVDGKLQPPHAGRTTNGPSRMKI